MNDTVNTSRLPLGFDLIEPPYPERRQICFYYDVRPEFPNEENLLDGMAVIAIGVDYENRLPLEPLLTRIPVNPELWLKLESALAHAGRLMLADLGRGGQNDEGDCSTVTIKEGPAELNKAHGLALGISITRIFLADGSESPPAFSSNPKASEKMRRLHAKVQAVRGLPKRLVSVDEVQSEVLRLRAMNAFLAGGDKPESVH